MIKAIALDVDGVLTDGTFWWDGAGAELKRFSFRDIMGVARASREGIIFALISGERNAIVDRYAAKMKITNVWQGCSTKADALREFSEKIGVPLHEIAFMGDDVNDLGAIGLAGFTACPGDAYEGVRQAVKLVTRAHGGNGAVREMLDHLNLGK
jgi:3-deoxy-D-manno-octulosonate 8-phosphate phosphatase (KDO 8-P phosphatase)